MKSTFLICAFPRSRTMWLSMFLSLPELSVCTHEATEFAGDPEEFWANGEQFCGGTDIYGNSDSANIFCLASMLAARPLTRVVWIERNIVEVARSCQAAKIPFTEDSLRTLLAMRDLHKDYFDVVINYEDLRYAETCRALWDFVLPGIPFDYGRWGLFDAQKLCYTAENPSPQKRYDKYLKWAERELGAIKAQRT
jgi:hypothetical protein